MTGAVGVGRHPRAAARRAPEGVAIVAPRGTASLCRPPAGPWVTVTNRALDALSDRLAHALAAAGIERGETTLVMVRAGIDLIALTYGLFKLGAVPVLIDPGMGRAAFLRSVATTAPTAFVGIPLAHALRAVFRAPFRTVRTSVTLGPRLFWGGARLERLVDAAPDTPFPMAEVAPDETAAVLFTSGSTGPAKGVVYTHGMFDAQVEALQATYGFRPGEVDLAAFPLFSLFDCAFGMTSVIPEIDPSRPGRCDPAKVVDAIRTHGATSAFGSPAVWRRVAPWCRARDLRLAGLRRVLIAGASVPPVLIEDVLAVIDPAGDVFTPYGASEALPVASLSGRVLVRETKDANRSGAGSCVGPTVGEVEARIIRVTDAPIPTWSDDLVVPDGTVGELCVAGPVVTERYHNREDATAAAKIREGSRVWHRMGDLAYRDRAGRLWFCGRKAERVETAEGPLYTEEVEGRAATDPRVARCALVGVGPRGRERPVLVLEGRPDPALAEDLRARTGFAAVLFHPRFPVDARHNAKIHRLTLKAWAERRLGAGP